MSNSVFKQFGLNGKSALVTGGSSGLGREIAITLARAGARVTIIGRDESKLNAVVAEIKALGNVAHSLSADISKSAECEGVAKEALQKFGSFDILVNNVGGRSPNTTIEETSLQQWRAAFAYNLDHVFSFTNIIGKSMIEGQKGGRIINIGSISGMIINRGVAGRHYETAKAAIIHFTKAVAVDWAVHNITANSISPGLFMTEPNQNWLKDAPEAIATFVENVPVGRAGQPEEISGLALYLASPASSYVTGSNFVIDGGYTAW